MGYLKRQQSGNHQLSLQVQGHLDFDSVPQIYREGCQWLQGAAPGEVVAFDFKEVLGANSAGLTLLLQWYRLAQKQGIQIQYQNLPQMLHKFGERLSVISLLPVKT